MTKGYKFRDIEERHVKGNTYLVARFHENPERSYFKPARSTMAMFQLQQAIIIGLTDEEGHSVSDVEELSKGFNALSQALEERPECKENWQQAPTKDIDFLDTKYRSLSKEKFREDCSHIPFTYRDISYE